MPDRESMNERFPAVANRDALRLLAQAAGTEVGSDEDGFGG